jgi:hypothetical protein
MSDNKIAIYDLNFIFGVCVCVCVCVPRHLKIKIIVKFALITASCFCVSIAQQLII